MKYMKAILMVLVILSIGLEVYNNNLERELIDTQEIITELERGRDELSEQIEFDLQAAITEPVSHYEIAEEVYGVDRYLLEAIERLETCNYTSNLYKVNNNTYGANDGKEYYRYDSHFQSTMELARTLRFNYIDMGIDTLEEINAIFCHDNPEWSNKVIDIYGELLMERNEENR